MQHHSTREQRWFWATLMLSSISVAAVVFSVWEVVENRFFRYVDYVTLHYLYITRGIASSLLLACWAAWFVLRERNRMWRKLIEIEKLTSMGEMAAGTAHHLNTPLAAMLLRVQMMSDRAPRGPLAADLDRLESGIRFCQQFVDRLLRFSHRPAPHKQPEEVGPLLQSVVSFLNPSFLAKRARVTLDADSVAGERVLADRNLLEVLFSTLLSNALDAIEVEGSIAIVCRKPSPDFIEVQISDQGCGIASSDLPRAFEPFFTTKGPGKGTGLGLPIARNIVLEHGGTIRLESAPGRGTTAFVQLPLA